MRTTSCSSPQEWSSDEFGQWFYACHLITEPSESKQVAPGAASNEKYATRRGQPPPVDSHFERIQPFIDLIR